MLILPSRFYTESWNDKGGKGAKGDKETGHFHNGLLILLGLCCPMGPKGSLSLS